MLARKPLLIHRYICWNMVLFFMCCEWYNQNSPHLCIFKMLRVKWGIQKCTQNGEKFSTPPSPLDRPRPRRGGWCSELNCRPPPWRQLYLAFHIDAGTLPSDYEFSMQPNFIPNPPDESNVLSWILLPVKDAQKDFLLLNAMHLDVLATVATSLRSAPLTWALVFERLAASAYELQVSQTEGWKKVVVCFVVFNCTTTFAERRYLYRCHIVALQGDEVDVRWEADR